MSYYIYIITTPNNKRYIGATQRTPKKRWDSGHGYKHNSYFWKSIQKYGWKSMDKQIIEVSSKQDMYYGEKYLIAYYNTTNSLYGFNHATGGASSTGYRFHHTEATKQKISNARKGKGNGMYGKTGWNKGLHTPYYGGGIQKGQHLRKTKWLTPTGNIIEMGRGQVHRFHPDWKEIS